MEQTSFSAVIKASSHNKPILLTHTFARMVKNAPLIIFSHGFKGFMNWGQFPAFANWFAANRIAFLRFNYSHNGTSIEHPDDFVDLDAFGNNNFSIELDDLDAVINYAMENADLLNIDAQKIYLVGHSRGGGLSILKAATDNRVKKLVTWAAVSDFESRLIVEGHLEWKKNGVTYVYNSRTDQQMPLNFQFYEDLVKNRANLFIQSAATKINIPFLVIHGTDDETVPFEEGKNIVSWNSGANFFAIENANHTFGIEHPANQNIFNEHTQQKLDATLSFLRE